MLECLSHRIPRHWYYVALHAGLRDSLRGSLDGQGSNSRDNEIDERQLSKHDGEVCVNFVRVDSRHGIEAVRVDYSCPDLYVGIKKTTDTTVDHGVNLYLDQPSLHTCVLSITMRSLSA